MLLILNKCRKAEDWLENTGQGKDNKGTIKAYVTKLCKYYYKLEKVFGDKSARLAFKIKI